MQGSVGGGDGGVDDRGGWGEEGGGRGADGDGGELCVVLCWSVRWHKGSNEGGEVGGLRDEDVGDKRCHRRGGDRGYGSAAVGAEEDWDGVAVGGGGEGGAEGWGGCCGESGERGIEEEWDARTTETTAAEGPEGAHGGAVGAGEEGVAEGACGGVETRVAVGVGVKVWFPALGAFEAVGEFGDAKCFSTGVEGAIGFWCGLRWGCIACAGDVASERADVGGADGVAGMGVAGTFAARWRGGWALRGLRGLWTVGRGDDVLWGIDVHRGSVDDVHGSSIDVDGGYDIGASVGSEGEEVEGVIFELVFEGGHDGARRGIMEGRARWQRAVGDGGAKHGVGWGGGVSR